MSLLQVQQVTQSRFPPGSSGSGGEAAVLLGLAVVAVLVLATWLLYREWRHDRLRRSVLVSETERWLRDRPGS
jgi:hypothetical protein